MSRCIVFDCDSPPLLDSRRCYEHENEQLNPDVKRCTECMALPCRCSQMYNEEQQRFASGYL